MTFVIINGEIDLSVASVMASRACVMAALHEAGSVPFELAVVIALLAATAAGLDPGRRSSPSWACRRWSSRWPA